MKKAIFFLFLYAHILGVAAQGDEVSEKLIAQKENVIKESTIIKIENLGHNINSDLAELRPTISADGNLLFFICENHPYNTKYNSIRNSQDIWYSERDSSGKWS